MNKETQIKICKSSIFFYISAVVFLLIGAYFIMMTYQTVSDYSQTTELGLTSILNVYFGNCAPYFAYAFICYGVGMILSKISELTQVFSYCIKDSIDDYDATQVSSEEVVEDETVVDEEAVNNETSEA